MACKAMSDKDSEKELAYFLDTDVHKKYLKLAKSDHAVAVSHLHDHTSPDARSNDELLRDLCELVIVLGAFIKLMETVAVYPIKDGEGYVLPPQDALLINFYLPMMETYELKVRSYGLSLAIN